MDCIDICIHNWYIDTVCCYTESRILDVMLVIYCAFYIKNISKIVAVTERSRKIE